MSLLEIEKLRLSIGAFEILKGVDLSIEQGEVLGLVGESGSGKSMTALAQEREGDPLAPGRRPHRRRSPGAA